MCIYIYNSLWSISVEWPPICHKTSFDKYNMKYWSRYIIEVQSHAVLIFSVYACSYIVTRIDVCVSHCGSNGISRLRWRHVRWLLSAVWQQFVDGVDERRYIIIYISMHVLISLEVGTCAGLKWER